MAAVNRAFARTKFKPMIFHDYSTRTTEEIVKDLNAAHARISEVVGEFNESQDTVKKLRRTCDLQEKHIGGLDKTNRRQNLMLLIQGLGVAVALLSLIVRLTSH